MSLCIRVEKKEYFCVELWSSQDLARSIWKTESTKILARLIEFSSYRQDCQQQQNYYQDFPSANMSSKTLPGTVGENVANRQVSHS